MKEDVKNISAPETEPTVRNSALYLPMWLTGLLGFLLYWGCNQLGEKGGQYSHLVYEPYHSLKEVRSVIPPDEIGTMMRQGEIVYRDYCAACHQATGMGAAGQAPPLAGSEWVIAPGANRLIRIPQVGVTGPIKVKGIEWNMTSMIGFAGNVDASGNPLVSDEKLAALLTYIRNSWGNKASMVTPEEVAKVRADLKAKGKTSQYTVEELLQLPEVP
jgi:mono/diheme cytochrome c family protein